MSTVDTVRARVEERLAGLPQDLLEELEGVIALDFQEHFVLQELQARAHAMGLIATDTAQFMYQALGEVGSQENGGWAEGTDLATKIVVIEMVRAIREA